MAKTPGDGFIFRYKREKKILPSIDLIGSGKNIDLQLRGVMC